MRLKDSLASLRERNASVESNQRERLRMIERNRLRGARLRRVRRERVHRLESARKQEEKTLMGRLNAVAAELAATHQLGLVAATSASAARAFQARQFSSAGLAASVGPDTVDPSTGAAPVREIRRAWQDNQEAVARNRDIDEDELRHKP
jgi:hypothetical protein